MSGLIRKDFYLCRKTLISFYLYLFATVGTTLILQFATGLTESDPQASPVILAVVCACISFVMANELQRAFLYTDERRVWNHYSASLPEGARGVVASKYTEVFILGFISFVICHILELACSFATGSTISFSMVYLRLLFFGLFLMSVEMPLGFAFGMKYAAAARILISVLLFLIASIWLLFGDIEWLMGSEGIYQSIVGMVEHLSDENMAKLFETMSAKWIIADALIMHLMVFLYYISYRISCAVYTKGAEHYDK